MNFSLSSEKLDDGADYIVSLGGEVDLYTAPELKQELHRLVGEGATRLVIDMSETTFIDSTTLGVLLSVVKRVRPEGGAVVARLSRPQRPADLRDHAARPRVRHRRHARRGVRRADVVRLGLARR